MWVPATMSIVNPGSGFVKSWLLGFPKNRIDLDEVSRKNDEPRAAGIFFRGRAMPGRAV
jgi:hypothetical protein